MKKLFILLLLNYYTSASYIYKSYQTSIYCKAEHPILYPSNVKDLQGIVKNAEKDGKTVKAIGSRHSITDIICTKGIPVSLKRIKHAVLSGDGRSATFGAGMELKDALLFLEQNGKTLIQVPSYGGITIGGGIATGAHGSSLNHPASLSDQVVGLTIITTGGELKAINDTKELKAWSLHLGLLGIVVDVTLSVVPLFKMTLSHNIQNEKILFNGAAVAWARRYDFAQIWWFPSAKNVVTATGIFHQNDKATIDGNDSSNFIPNLDRGYIRIFSALMEFLQRFRGTAALSFMEFFTQWSLVGRVIGKPPIFQDPEHPNPVLNKVPNKATGYAWRLQSNKCDNTCIWDERENVNLRPEESAMAFDISEFPRVMRMIKKVLKTFPASFAMVGIFIRFCPASNRLMSIANGREIFTVEWSAAMRMRWDRDAKDGLGSYQWMLQEMVANHGGRPHWGKNGLHYFTNEVFNGTLQHREEFIQAMKKYDPVGTYLNRFGRRVLGVSNEMDVSPGMKRCALQDYCICKKNKDCGIGQRCLMVEGQFHICRDLGLNQIHL